MDVSFQLIRMLLESKDWQQKFLLPRKSVISTCRRLTSLELSLLWKSGRKRYLIFSGQKSFCNCSATVSTPFLMFVKQIYIFRTVMCQISWVSILKESPHHHPIVFELYLVFFLMCLQKKELESQEPAKPSTEKPAGEKPRVARNFNQKRPVADGMTSNVATLSHDVLAGVSVLFLLVHQFTVSACTTVLHSLLLINAKIRWSLKWRLMRVLLLLLLHSAWSTLTLAYFGRFLARSEWSSGDSIYLGRVDYGAKWGRHELSFLRLQKESIQVFELKVLQWLLLRFMLHCEFSVCGCCLFFEWVR